MRKTQHITVMSKYFYTLIYLLLENSAELFSNLMNLGEIYIFLYQHHESGKRLFYNFLTHFLTIKRSGI